MKKTFILSTLLAVALAAGILFVSCDTPTSSKGDDKDSNNSGGNGGSVISNGGDTLKLSGQVYRLEQNYDSNDITTSISITPYTGPDKNFTYRGGTGSIRNGQFSFTIGIPDSLESSFFYDRESGPWSDMSVAPSDTKGCSFVGTDSYGYTDYFLVRGNQVMTWTSSTTYSGTQEQVFYIYVDKACTITATGETETDEYGTSTYQNVNLKLNKGWNAVTQKMTGTWNTESHTSNITISMTVGELSTCKWLIMY